MVPFQAGAAPPVLASAPNVTVGVPFEWLVLVGTTWHSVQAMACRVALCVRWLWCAPTARAVVAVSPLVPLGGAAGFVARVPSPWQDVQLRLAWHWTQAVRPPVTDG